MNRQETLLFAMYREFKLKYKYYQLDKVCLNHRPYDDTPR